MSKPIIPKDTPSTNSNDNVIVLSEYVENNLWSLLNKGHFKDFAAELNALEEEEQHHMQDFDNADGFYVELPVPANDEGTQNNEIAISLEDLVETEQYDILSNDYRWADEELDPDRD